MTIIKTAQFNELLHQHHGHHEHHDDGGSHGSAIQDLISDVSHGHEDVDPSELDAIEDAPSHDHDGMTDIGDDLGGDDLGGMPDEHGNEDFGDALNGIQGLDDGNMPTDGDGSIEFHLDSPNDLGGDLPVDIDIDSGAFGHDEFGGDDLIGDHGNPDDFNEMSFDGELDGNVDFDQTNDMHPDGRKDGEDIDGDLDMGGLHDDLSDLDDDLGDFTNDLGDDFDDFDFGDEQHGQF